MTLGNVFAVASPMHVGVYTGHQPHDPILNVTFEGPEFGSSPQTPIKLTSRLSTSDYAFRAIARGGAFRTFISELAFGNVPAAQVSIEFELRFLGQVRQDGKMEGLCEDPAPRDLREDGRGHRVWRYRSGRREHREARAG